jgi:DNA-directed RNA polymerase subunit RPC12/RpoP
MKAGEKQRAPRKQPAPRFVSVPVLMTAVACPDCGANVELWTNEEETCCFACGHAIFEAQRLNH